MDHRRLQRTLFRMQHDDGFAARLRAGNAEAAGSTGLCGEDLAYLCALDAAAVAADRGGQRRAQLLRNVGSEFAACTALGPDRRGDRRWIEAFPASRHFHEAVARDGRLPLAFACYAEETARACASPDFAALVGLEASLARLRRQPPLPQGAPPPGCLLRAADATLLRVPEGTHALAEALHASGPAQPRPSSDPARAVGRVHASRSETLLVVASPAPHPGGLRALHVEALPPLLAEFLEAAGHPLAAEDRNRFARAHDLDPGRMEAVVAGLLAEGVLRAGP